MSSPKNFDAITPAIQALLDSQGVSIDELAAHLNRAESPAPAGARRATIDTASAAASLALDPGAVKNYRSYWRVLAVGIVLPATWSSERLERYAADLAAIDREQKLGLAIPTDIHACPRERRADGTDGGVIVQPGHGDAWLDDITTFDVQILTKWVGGNALAKAREQDRQRAAKGDPPTRKHGKSAQENFIGAIRCLYKAAGKNRMVASGYSPAASIEKPARNPAPTRRSMTDSELRDVWITCSTTGNDPELDALIFRTQMETCSRQEGCINLVLNHLDDERQSIWLDQKGDTTEEFPVSASLLRDLRAFAASRGSTEPHDHVFRQKGRHRNTGQINPPLTSRRFDHIHDRMCKQHQWANLSSWTSHWVRHHASAQIEAIGGRPCKMRILAHKPNGQTDMYGRATFEQLAWAVSIATGEPHPLAQRPSWVTGGA